MPIYAFACTSCGHHFDRLQKMSDPEPETCPSCGKATVKRQLTAPSFRLSGSGWYETDFKKDSDKKRNLVETSGADGASKAEPKPSGSGADAAAPKSTEGSEAAAASKPAAKGHAAATAKPAAAAKPSTPSSDS